MKSLITVLVLLGAINPSFAQDAKGNDTPGDWVATHYQTFGSWDSICDQADRDGATVDRCYLRYVDVFSSTPKFAAQFVFITPENEGLKIEFGIEKGTLFKGEGLKVINDGQELWSFDPNKCLNFGDCVFEGTEAAGLIAAMSKAYNEKSVFVSDFTDRHGADRVLEWDLTKFPDALTDFNKQSELRGLNK